MQPLARNVFFALLTALAPGCDAKSGVRSEAPRSGLPTLSASAAPADARPSPPASKSSGEAPGESGREERLLIQRGELDVEVARPDDVAKAFLVKVKELGGHLASQRGASLVVRVPAERFDEAFAVAGGFGRVLRESREASDVTEEFVDLGIRIDTALKARDRLLGVLQKAERIEDILKVEAELRRLTEEIERLEGRRKFLADQVALATLEVLFRAPDGPPPPLRRVRHGSRFAWINQVGVESLMENF